MATHKSSRFRTWCVRRKLRKLAKLIANLSQERTKVFIEEEAMYDTFLDLFEGHLLDDLLAYDRAANLLLALHSFVRERQEDNKIELQHRPAR